MADRLAAARFAARRLLGRCSPHLLGWASDRWENWLETQRCPEEISDGSTRRIVVVAALNCLEDLPLHVGLMQLLANPGLRCTVVLVFPNDRATLVAKAQARRDEWHLLVHLISQSELFPRLERLPSGELLAVFPLPALLGAQALQALSSPAHTRESRAQLVGDDSFFLGSAEGFLRWARAHEVMDEKLLISTLTEVLRAPVGDLAELTTTVPGAAQPAGQVQVMAPRETGLEIRGSWESRELVVRDLEETAHRSVIVRQRGELLDGERPVRIRMPARFLTARPRRIQVESRSPGGRTAWRDVEFRIPPSHLEPWMISALLNRGGGGNPMIRAFAQGTGCRIAYAEDEPSTLSDIPVVWGVLRQSDRIVSQAKAQGLYFFYIDHAYFERGHGKNYRITRNAYEAGAVRKCPADRIAKLGIELLPWQQGGREIIVCPPTEYFMQAHGCPDWLETTLAALGSHTDRPIIVRVKPQEGEQAVPLPKALQTAHALVTHSSNVAIEAACLGTPIFVAPASAAAPVGLTDLSQIEAPVHPDREPWLAHLAYNQFSFEEIGDGRAWQMLLELEEREFA